MRPPAKNGAAATWQPQRHAVGQKAIISGVCSGAQRKSGCRLQPVRLVGLLQASSLLCNLLSQVDDKRALAKAGPRRRATAGAPHNVQEPVGSRGVGKEPWV